MGADEESQNMKLAVSGASIASFLIFIPSLFFPSDKGSGLVVGQRERDRDALMLHCLQL